MAKAVEHIRDEPAVPALVVALNDPQDNVRQSAVDALGMIGPDAAPAVPALVAVLNDPEDKVGWIAASALGKIGPDAAPAVPALVAALNGPSARWTAAGDRATAAAAAIRANKAQADLAERGHCDNLQRRRAGAPAGAATRCSVV